MPFSPIFFAKSCLIVFLNVWAYMSLMAQNNPDHSFFLDDHHHEVGADVTKLLLSAIGNAATLVQDNPHLISYKYRLANGNALRTGLGLELDNLNRPGTRLDVNRQSFSGRLGYEWRKYLEKRWVAFFGLDLLASYSSENAFTDGNNPAEIIFTNRQFGGGPVIGLQFALNKRLMIGTEASLYASYQEDVQSVEFEIETNLNDSNFSNHSSLKLTPPQWFYLSFRI